MGVYQLISKFAIDQSVSLSIYLSFDFFKKKWLAVLFLRCLSEVMNIPNKIPAYRSSITHLEFMELINTHMPPLGERAVFWG